MPRATTLLAAAAALALPLPAGCVDRPVTQVEPQQDTTENLAFSVALNRNLDILFVVDDSRSMQREQLEITENFHRMIEVLETLPTGLPNIHIGVVSTDVGAGEACPDSSGAGVLRNRPMISGCNAPSDRWIEDIDDGAGGRTRNYAGDLSDSFACIASLGIDGCGFEQPLEAMRRALSPDTAANLGFLREDALLAVVFLTDEDDCSAFDPDLFDADTSVLGPRENFRCFQHGLDCEGIDPTQLGPRENCVPRDDSPYLTPVDEYVQALRDLKPFDSRIVVAGIMGKDGPIEVIRDADDNLNLKRTCEIDTSDPQGAFAPLRTDAFLAQFDNRVRTSICDPDLSPAMVQIAEVIKVNLPGSCITSNLRDANLELAGLQADCSVTEIQHLDDPEQEKTILPQCDATDSNQPCWALEVNEAVCGTTPTKLEVVTRYRPEDVRDTGTVISVQCATE